MKKIVNILLSATALLAIVPFAKADGEGGSSTVQEGRDYILDGSIGYKKSISTPNTDGVYTITLESFATGSSTKIQKSVRSDIVLVLDVSGSMRESMNDGTYTALDSQAYSYNSYGNNTYYYLHTDGKYYQVSRDNYNYWGTNYRYLTFRVGNTQYYLSGTGVTTDFPTNATSGNATIWTGVLYQPTTRLDALKDAVYTFIDLIAENDSDNAPAGSTSLGNKIAIVPFESSNRGITPLTSVAGSGAQTLKDAVKNLNADGGTNAHLGMQEAYSILNGNTSTAQLKTAVLFTDGIPGLYGNWTNNDTWTSATSTIGSANNIKNLAHSDPDPSKEIIANVFTVSIIPGDGGYTDVYLGKTSSDWLGATGMGSRNTWNSTNIWANGNGSRNPKSKDYSTTDDDSEKIDFSLTASSADELKAAFETIAGESGGSALPMTEESIAEVDVVSQSFVIPPDVNKEDIVIKIAKCSTKVEKTFVEDGVEKTDKFFIFETPKTINIFSDPKVLSGYTYDKKVVDSEGQETGEVLYNTPVDGSLSLDFAKSDPDLEKEDMVTLTGFNYGALFCGPVYDEGWTAEMEGSENHIDHYTGYKVILEIPIKMNPKAVGGPDVDTNAEGSGIKIGNSTIPFKSPHVSLPVNIWIRKDGLEVGESAKFIIERAVIPSTWPKLGDEDYPTKSTDGRYDALSWEPVSSVFVTRHKGQDKDGVNAPVTKAVGLPSVDDHDNEFIYRIIESTDWSWSYTQGTTSIFTTDLLETNPFIFYNTKKAMIDVEVRHAESKATNTFKDGNFVVNNKVVKKVNADHVGYDDSKNNNRTVIEIENNATEGTE